MKTHTDYLTFDTKRRQEIIDITDAVERCRASAKINEGMVLVSAMRTGEVNVAAHLRSLTIGHEVIMPVTAGRLDLGPWQRIFYGEWDGQRPKRVILKAMGD